MSESPRELAAKIADGEDAWIDADAVLVSQAYLVACETVEAARDYLDGREANE